MKNVFVGMIAAALLAACALPETGVKTGSPRPTLAVKGAPAGAVLFVDGLQVGVAAEYDANPKVLIVEEGVHKVDVRQGSGVLHTEKVFVSAGELKTITVNAGGQ